MKKTVLLRGLNGFPLGIAIGQIITIALSLGWAQGKYIPYAPELAASMGSETGAVLLQTLLCGILGSSFGSCSVIWEIENWSIAKQTCIYFLITSVVMMPIAYFTNWMPHTLIGFLLYFGVFAVIFIVIWIAQYLIWRNRIKEMNSKIDKR